MPVKDYLTELSGFQGVSFSHMGQKKSALAKTAGL